MISVIITTYKRDYHVLERAISSVLKQTYRNFELIVVDDNGANNKYQDIVQNVVNHFSSIRKIKLIKHGINLGAQRARNTGIKHARGEYIAFLDDDDEWLERKLELQMEKFNKSNVENLGLVYCWFNHIQQKGNEKYIKKVRKSQVKENEVYNKLFYRNVIGPTSLPLIKKECFETVGYFDESLEAKQDYDMWIRICKHYKCDYVSEPLCNYYDHKQERISNNLEKKIRAEKVFYKKYYNEITKSRKTHGIKKRIIGTLYLKNNDFDNARKYIMKSIQIYPLSIKSYALVLLTFISKVKLVGKMWIKS